MLALSSNTSTTAAAASTAARHLDEASSSDDKTPTARWVATFASTAHTSSFKPTHGRRASRITVHLASRDVVDEALTSLQAKPTAAADEDVEELQSHDAAPPAALPPHLIAAKARPRANTLSDLSDASTVRPSDSTTRTRRRSKTLFQARVTAQRRQSRTNAAAAAAAAAGVTASPRTPRRVSSRRNSVSLRVTSPCSVASSQDLDSMDDVLANFSQFIDSGYVSASSPSGSSSGGSSLASPASRGTSSSASTSNCGSPQRIATRSLLAELEAWSSSDDDDDNDTDTQTTPAKSIASSRRVARKQKFSTPEASPVVVSTASRHAVQLLGRPFDGHDALATLSSIRAIEKLSLQSARSMPSPKRTRRKPARRLPPQRDPRGLCQLPLPPPPTPSKAGISRPNAALLLQQHSSAQAMARQRSGSSVSSGSHSSISYSSYSSSGSSLLCIPGDEEAMALRDGLGSWSFDSEAGSRCPTPDSSVSACGSSALKPPRPARSPRRPSMEECTGQFPTSSPKGKSRPRQSRSGMPLPDIKIRSASLTATTALDLPVTPHTPVRNASLAASPEQLEQIRAYRAGSISVADESSSRQAQTSSNATSPKAPFPVLKPSAEAVASSASAASASRTPRADFGSYASVADFVAGAEKASKAQANCESPERAAPRFRERLAGFASLSMRNVSSLSLRDDAKAGAGPIDEDYVCPSPVPRQRGLSGSLSRGASIRLRTASIASATFDEQEEAAPPSPRGGFSFLKRPSMSRLGQSSLRVNTSDTAAHSPALPSPSPSFRNPFSSDASLLSVTSHDEASEHSGSPARANSRLGLSGIGWGRARKLSAADMLVADYNSSAATTSATQQAVSNEDLLANLRRGSMLGRTLWA